MVQPPNPIVEVERAPSPSFATDSRARAPVPPKSEPEEPAPRASEDVTLELCAAVTARIDAFPSQRAALLEEERLDDDAWQCASGRWAEAMAAALQRADSSPMERFDDGYVAALEVLRGPIDAETFAALEVAIERGRLDEVIVGLGIVRPAVIRIKRCWTRRLLRDAQLRESVRRAIAERRKW